MVAAGKRYTEDEGRTAVDYRPGRGKGLAGTMRALGYPKGSETLVTRMDGLAPGWRRHRGPGLRKGDASLERKAWAVAELGARPGTAAEVADRHGVARDMPHRWRGAMLGDGCGDVETRGVMPF